MVESRSSAAQPAASPLLEVRGLSVWAGERQLLRGIDLEVMPGQVLGVIGPSGCGKTTFLRCLNRLVDLISGLRVSGEVRFAGRSIYGADCDADALRAEVGMLFQQPAVFPGSIAENVIFGARRIYRLARTEQPARVEWALREAGLWDEVADRLSASAVTLSVGQQQRLCLARALAMKPRVLLLDEPTSALDERASAQIEELVLRLAKRLTLIMVTHDLAQARRVTDQLARFELRQGVGEMVQQGPTHQLLALPRRVDSRRENLPPMARSAVGSGPTLSPFPEEND